MRELVENTKCMIIALPAMILMFTVLALSVYIIYLAGSFVVGLSPLTLVIAYLIWKH